MDDSGNTQRPRILDALFATDFDGTFTLGINTQVLILETLGLGRLPLEKLPEMTGTLRELWHLHKTACFDALRAHVRVNERIAGDWADFVKEIAAMGFHHLIHSFHIFGEDVAPWFFHEMLGLSYEFIYENMDIVSFWPERGIHDNKNLHLERGIALAVERKKIAPPLKKNRVVFTDDNGSNCLAANEAGYILTVQVRPRGTHIEELRDHARRLHKFPACSVQKENRSPLTSSSESSRSLLSSSMEKLFNANKDGGTPYVSWDGEKSPLRRSPGIN